MLSRLARIKGTVQALVLVREHTLRFVQLCGTYEQCVLDAKRRWLP